jgi:hypothetical protein
MLTAETYSLPAEGQGIRCHGRNRGIWIEMEMRKKLANKRVVPIYTPLLGYSPHLPAVFRI